MSQHKWHKEIKAWADGVKVYGRMDTHKSIIAEFEVTELSQFDIDSHSFYIKPQPKEPQYLYVFDNGYKKHFSDKRYGCIIRTDGPNELYKYIGKIKLEQDDE